jgi:hypothetical protein
MNRPARGGCRDDICGVKRAARPLGVELHMLGHVGLLCGLSDAYVSMATGVVMLQPIGWAGLD